MLERFEAVAADAGAVALLKRHFPKLQPLLKEMKNNLRSKRYA